MRTEPVAHPPSDSSCIRLRQRRNVLFPQPEGPMRAVTVLVGKNRETSRTATLRPYNAVRRRVSMRTTGLSRPGVVSPSGEGDTAATSGALSGTLGWVTAGSSGEGGEAATGLLLMATPGYPASHDGQ